MDFDWRDPGIRRILILMLPAVIAASAVQINVMVNSIFASYLGNGPISWLSYAFRLMQLPLGVFGVAVATVTLPVVSRASALGDMDRFRSTLAKAMRLAVFLTLPSAVGLIVLAQPIIALIYQRGNSSTPTPCTRPRHSSFTQSGWSATPASRCFRRLFTRSTGSGPP